MNFFLSNGKALKLVDKYLSSNISSPETNVNLCIVKVSTATEK